MILNYRGRPLAEIVPLGAPDTISPQEALHLAQEQAASYGATPDQLEQFASTLRRDQEEWSRRTSS